MTRRTRGAALAATGLLAAVAPLFAGQSPAGATVYEGFKQTPLTFIDTSGSGVTCTLDNFSHHNTNDPDQPYIDVSLAIDGPAECQDLSFTEVDVSFKDKDGVKRTAFALGTGMVVHGAYSAVMTSVSARYRACDETKSASCLATAETSTK